MPDVDAEADPLDARQVGLVLRQRAADGVQPLERQGMGAGVDALQFGDDVLPTRPEMVGIQGYGIGHPGRDSPADARRRGAALASGVT